MKTKYLIGLLLLAAGLIIVSTIKTPAQNDRRGNPAFVEIMYGQAYVNSRPTPTRVIFATAYGDGIPELTGKTLAEADVILSVLGFEPEAPTVYSQRIYRRH